MATDFLRNLLKAKDPNNNDEDPATKTGIVPGEENGPPVLPWNNDGSMILISKSDLVYYVIIAILSLGMIIMFVEYRRLVSKYKRNRDRNQRKISDLLLSNPTEALPEVKEHLQDAIKEVAEFVVPMRSQRFRKRDRMYFIGRRFMRKMTENVGGLAKVSRDPSTRRKAISRLTKNFLRYGYPSSEDGSTDGSGVLGGPAEEYLEEEEDPTEQGCWVPPELSYLLNSFYMFGHFDKAIFLELCKSIQTVPVPAGQYLFRIGDPDEFVHVVQSGKMNVHIVDSDNRSTTIKTVKAGETVSSLLSFIDVMTGYPSPFKTVCCKAVTDSLIIRLPAAAFQEVFLKNPDMLIRVVQLIMARLQRVCFVALHQYLGLTSELIRQFSEMPPTPNLSDDSLSMGDDLDLAASHQDIIAATTAATGASAKKDLHLQVQHVSSDPYEMLMNMAVKGFQRELDIHDNVEFLRDRIEIRSLSVGDVLMTEDSHSDASLTYILSGSLVMSQRSEQEATPEGVLYTAYRGECVGQLAMLTGEANFYSCKAKDPNTRVAILTRETFFEIVCETPEMVLSLAHQIISRLSPLVRQVDFALDWINIESGKALYRQTENTDGTFIVLSGRLRSVIDTSLPRHGGADEQSGQNNHHTQRQSSREDPGKGKKQLVDEYTRGDMVGLVDVVTATNRLTSVVAVRDSELCKVPANLLNLLKSKYPVVVSRLISLLGHRLLGTWHSSAGSNTHFRGSGASGGVSEKDSLQQSYTTVAVYPSGPAVPLSPFCWELAHALTVAGPVTILSSSIAIEKLGSSAFEAGHDYRLNAWLGQQEHRHKVVIYQCDREMTKWTSRCLRQADVIFDLVLPDGDSDSDVTRQEKELESTAKRVRKELVLLHPEETVCPQNTREWLKKRPWISSHFHLKATKRFFTRRREESKIREFYSRLMQSQAPNIHSDFSRLARHVTGTSVGLVLGGGGARGAAHIGMLKAIQEAGIPVDKLGGVSIGAFVGGLWGSSRDMVLMTQKARSYFDLLGNRWLGPIMDFTYPHVSLFTGSYFNWTLRETFGEDLMIEDLWLPFFCCTTDISVSQERVHTKGIFWKYCRASMSYAWLLPPLCDPVDGHLLMDGCYVNNVPGDVMATQGCKYILAIDVTALDDRNLTNYGDTLSGLWILWQKINPFADPIKIPHQSEIQMRLAFCSHYKNLEELKNNPNYEYIQPPIDKYASGAFKLFDEIREVGYHHGNTFFTGLRKAGQSSQLHHASSHGSHHHPQYPWSSHHRSSSPGASPPWFPGQSHHLWQWSRSTHQERRDSGTYTFTDLAQMVCQNYLKDRSGSSSPQFRSRAGSIASKNSRNSEDDPRRRRRSGRRSGDIQYAAPLGGGGGKQNLSSPSHLRNRQLSSHFQQQQQQQQQQQSLYNQQRFAPDFEDESDDTGIML